MFHFVFNWNTLILFCFAWVSWLKFASFPLPSARKLIPLESHIDLSKNWSTKTTVYGVTSLHQLNLATFAIKGKIKNEIKLLHCTKIKFHISFYNLFRKQDFLLHCFPFTLDHQLWKSCKIQSVIRFIVKKFQVPNTLQRGQEPSISLCLTNVMPCCFVLHRARAVVQMSRLSVGPPIWPFLIKFKLGIMIHEGHWLGFGAEKAESE